MWILPAHALVAVGAVALASGSSSCPSAACGRPRSVWASPPPGYPGGCRLLPLVAWCLVTFPVGAGPSFWSSRAGFWGLKPGEDWRFAGGVQMGSGPECDFSADLREGIALQPSCMLALSPSKVHALTQGKGQDLLSEPSLCVLQNWVQIPALPATP